MALAYEIRPDVCLTIDYGQPAFHGERKASKQICQILDLRHETLMISIYRHKPSEEHQSFWPFRNQLLVSAAAANFSDERQKTVISLGLVRDDVYPDCKDTFVRKIRTLVNIQNPHLDVQAPAIDVTTLQLLRRSDFPPDLLGLTFSCHFADFPCGECPGCKKNHDITNAYRRQPSLRIVSD